VRRLGGVRMCWEDWDIWYDWDDVSGVVGCDMGTSTRPDDGGAGPSD